MRAALERPESLQGSQQPSRWGQEAGEDTSREVELARRGIWETEAPGEGQKLGQVGSEEINEGGCYHLENQGPQHTCAASLTHRPPATAWPGARCGQAVPQMIKEATAQQPQGSLTIAEMAGGGHRCAHHFLLQISPK